MNKNILYQLLALLLLFGISTTTHAQVTIGGGTKPKSGTVLDLNPAQGDPLKPGNIGGLLLPNVKITDLEKIPMDFSDVSVRGLDQVLELAGTVVYNIHPATGEGLYLWDGERWKQAGTGGLVSDGCESKLINKDGETISCQITDPTCEIAGEYKFEILSGKDFLDLEIVDSGTGRFNLIFRATNRGEKRTAIVMVVSPCGATGTFLYNQDADLNGCSGIPVPDIKTSTNTTNICGGGSLNLYLDTPESDTRTYIWTLNGEVLETKNNSPKSYTATKAGRYIVYGDKYGCPGSKEEIVLSMSTTPAPSPVMIKAIANNGIACVGIGGAGTGVVRVITTQPSRGTVTWYHNGAKSVSITGTDVDLTVGTWWAVVEEGNCSSTATESILIKEDTSGSSITAPAIRINGKDNNYELCKGGSMLMEITNPEAGVRYTWYVDGTEVGSSERSPYEIYQKVPASSDVVIRVRATGTGCAQETLITQTISTTQAPAAPSLVVDRDPVICGGNLTLKASTSAVGITGYKWYRDGVEAGNTAGDVNTFRATQLGSYSVSTTIGTCMSLRSNEMKVTGSDYGIAKWKFKYPSVNITNNKTFEVEVDRTDKIKYVWTVSDPLKATIIYGNDGNGSNTCSVDFIETGAVTVSCYITNACGEVKGVEVVNGTLSCDVTIQGNCTPASIDAQSAKALSIFTTQDGNKQNIKATLTADISGGPELIANWYAGDRGQHTGTAVSLKREEGVLTSTSFTTPTVALPGISSYYCRVEVKGGCEGTDAKFSENYILTATRNPASLPQGTGTLTGRNSFDLAANNDKENGCGPLASRKKTDFSDRTLQDPALNPNYTQYSGVQIYTFTPKTGETVLNLRYEFVNVDDSKLIERINPVIVAGDVSSAQKVTVYFYENLNSRTDILNSTRATAKKAILYAIYGPVGSEKRQRLDIDVSDCGGCGAKTVGDGWLTFMCHNLGADQSLNPFEWYSKADDDGSDIKGDLYQWGREMESDPSKLHAKRNSDVADAVTGAALDVNGQIKTTDTRYGKFIRTSASNLYDWRNPQSNTLWGNGKQDADQPKTVNDPCPDGWKVPSQLQWSSIFRGGTISGDPTTSEADVWNWTGNGYMIGENLYLPAAGERTSNTGTIFYVGDFGSYWSSTVNFSTAYYMNFSVYDVWHEVSDYRASGYSVRCVAE